MAGLEYTVHNVAVTPNQKRWKQYAKPQSKAGVKRPNSTEASKKSQHMQKVRAFMLLGGKCYECGDNRMQGLELDHVHNNGAEERRKFGRNNAMIKEVLKRPSDFKLLCGTCHNLKTSGYIDADAVFNKGIKG